MISTEQFELLIHLKQYGVANSETCKLFVDDYNLRPLVRYKYISHNNKVYRLLKKGHELVGHIESLVTISGNHTVIDRAVKTSFAAALFKINGIGSSGEFTENSFIPSNKWREIRSGIISTTRFNGMLCYKGLRLAVYYIGDGNMEWQAFAEGSLFFRNYGTYETKATGMLLICDDSFLNIAERIIRYTMWNRKSLIKDGYQLESDKRREYSKSPIRLRSTYERVFIADKSDVLAVIDTAANEQKFLEYFLAETDGYKISMPEGDIEVHPTRYYVNLHGDLLKMIHFFSSIKAEIKYLEKPVIDYNLIISERYLPLVKMYKLKFSVILLNDSEIGEIVNGTDI